MLVTILGNRCFKAINDHNMKEMPENIIRRNVITKGGIASGTHTIICIGNYRQHAVYPLVREPGAI